MTIGTRLFELRGKKSLTELGEKLGVSGQQLSRIENDKSTPSLDLTLKICAEFGVSMDWFIKGVGQMKLGEISSEPESEYVTITKDELISLQRVAIEKQNNVLQERDNELSRFRK